MMRYIYIIVSITIACLFESGQIQAQVGINTQVLDGILHIDSKSNNLSGATTKYDDDVVVDNNGQVAVGTNIPTAKMHIQGSFILDDGNQAQGKVLVYDGVKQAAQWEYAENTCYWIKPIDLVNIIPPANAPAYMGKSITLPKGSWIIKYATTWSFLNTGGLNGYINTYLSSVNTGSFVGSSDIIPGSWVISEALAGASFSSSQNMLVVTVTASSQTLYLWAYYNNTTLTNLKAYEPGIGTNVLEAIRWE